VESRESPGGKDKKTDPTQEESTRTSQARVRVACAKLRCYNIACELAVSDRHLKAMSPAFFKAFPAIAPLLLTAAALHAEPADELIAKGDVYYINLQAAEALKYYLPAERLEPNNVRLLVRISREYRHLMSDATKPEEMLRLGGTAVDYAKRAVVFDPEDPEAQLAVAISYGKLQPLEDNREKIEALHIIKNAADKAIKLNPRSDLGWHVLGRWHKGLADLNAFQRAMARSLSKILLCIRPGSRAFLASLAVAFEVICFTPALSVLPTHRGLLAGSLCEMRSRLSLCGPEA
jgi:tetratricopeptide (TPR) repeat protein